MMDGDSWKSSEVLSSNTNNRRSASQSFGHRRNAVRTGANQPEPQENVNVAASAAESYQPAIPRPNTFAHHRSHTLASSLKSSDPALQQMSGVGVTSPGSPADSSPRDTRIPRPKTTAPTSTTSPNSPGQYNRHQRQPTALRQPMSLKSAFKLAQAQQTDDGTIDLNQAFNMASAEANRGIDASPSPAPRNYRLRPESRDANHQNTNWGRRGSELGQQLQKFDRNHQLGRASAPLNGLFTNNRAAPKISETDYVLVSKPSNDSLGSDTSNRRMDQRNGNSTRGREKESPMGSTTPGSGSVASDRGDQGHPIPSIEFESPTSDERLSHLSQFANTSPEKSFNWHLDADFTAGDLQISNSPRIRTKKTTTGSPADSPRDRETPKFRRSNDKLNQIREREARAQSIPLPEETSTPPRKNTKLDEIRAREIEALSKRAVATSRLDEIRARNSESRSESPEIDRRSSKDSLREELLGFGHKPVGIPEKLTSEQKNEQHAGHPSNEINNFNNGKEGNSTKAPDNVSNNENKVTRDTSPKDDSHELLRRLARAASQSPSPPLLEKPRERLFTEETSSNPKSEEVERSRPHSIREERRPKILDIKGSRERPTVGFVGLKRVASSDSLQSKRASMPTSEVDPTDRIEAEMKLFAPLDNYSERGSVRALSPLPPESMDEETPRPTRIDLMTLPTPRVTGAYVETPATVRVKDEDDLSDKVASDSVLHTSHSLRRVRNLDSNTQVASTANGLGSNEGASATRSRVRSSSLPGVRRSRSACRRRRRPLINTAKPISAKDDLRAILRRHEIDDSTLEDFDERLSKHEIGPEELEQMVEDTTLKVEDDPEPDLPDNERELQPYARMGKSLKTLLADIRTAKQGIERLEDKVTHTEHKPKTSKPEIPNIQFVPSPDSTAIVVSVPLLWRRDPKFKLTTLGVISLLLAIWWPLELVFSHYYAAQYQCTDYVPCDWSPNEPYYPYTMPFMLDEWATGGKGREMVFRIGEELGDIAAEASDWITNTDFTQRDERYMNVWERKRHRRRLRKHDLYQKWIEPLDYQFRYDAWEAARRAREEAQELGYDTDDGESMSADESIR